VTEATRAKFDARCHPKFWVAWETSVTLAVVAQAADVKVPVQRAPQVLRSNTMTGLIEESWEELVRAGAEEGVEHANLRHGVKSTTSVTPVAASRPTCSEADDRVPRKLNVGSDRITLLGRKRLSGERID
jgi:hypothetical protein